MRIVEKFALLRISIHTLRMEGDGAVPLQLEPAQAISIHTLRMEGDRRWSPEHRWWEISIHTLRMEGDSDMTDVDKALIISIHTLRMEGDSKSAQKSRTLLFKVTDLRRNCRPDVHERTEDSLWQAVFAG